MPKVSRFCGAAETAISNTRREKAPTVLDNGAQKPYFALLTKVVRRRGGEAAETILDVRGAAWRFVL